jgi:hypothetical protein
MGERRLRLTGFETELLGFIAAGFRFSDPSLRDLGLVLDRNLFAQFLPDAKDIAETAQETDNGFPFDPLKEPAVCLYRQPGAGIPPTSSSGSRLAFNILIVLRTPASLQEAADMLGELVVWLELHAPGASTLNYIVRGYQTLGMPVPFQRYADNKSAASSAVRFLAVARV